MTRAPAAVPSSEPELQTIDVSNAYALHRAGRYADAARVYQALLERDPDDPAVLHLFGVMHQQCGHSARAVVSTI